MKQFALVTILMIMVGAVFFGVRTTSFAQEQTPVPELNDSWWYNIVQVAKSGFGCNVDSGNHCKELTGEQNEFGFVQQYSLWIEEYCISELNEQTPFGGWDSITDSEFEGLPAKIGLFHWLEVTDVRRPDRTHFEVKTITDKNGIFVKVQDYCHSSDDPQDNKGLYVGVWQYETRYAEWESLMEEDISHYVLTILRTAKENGWVPPTELSEEDIPDMSPPPATIPDAVSAEVVEPETEAGSLPSEVDVKDGKMTPQQEVQVIGATLTGAVVGTIAASTAAGINARKKQQATVVVSPIDGKPVSASQAAWEQAQLDAGMVYDPSSDSFKWSDTPEMYRGPSILSREHKEYLAKKERKQKKAIEDKRKLERKIEIEEQMEQYQKDYQRYMDEADKWDRYSKIASSVEKIADNTLTVCEHFTGPAGKIVKTAYDRVKDVNSYANDVYDHGLVKGSAKFALDKAEDQVKDKITDKLFPGAEFSSNPVIDVIGNQVFQDVTSTGVDHVTNKVVEKMGNLMTDKVKDLTADELKQVFIDYLADEGQHMTSEQISRIQEFLTGGVK